MAIRFGYAHCSTHAQDLEAQCKALLGLGVAEDRIYTDHGVTGAGRDRPGLGQTLTALREGATLVASKLDRLVHSVPDALDIAKEIERQRMAIAKEKLPGKKPKLSEKQRKELWRMHDAGEYSFSRTSPSSSPLYARLPGGR